MTLARTVALAAAAAVLVQCSAPPAPPPAPSPSTRATSSPTRQPSTLPQPAAVHPVTAANLGATWRPECPVSPDELRRVDVDYWGFDGQVHRGELVVNRLVTDDVIAVFDRLVALRFPIEKMQTPDHYPGAEDELSMRDNNTSAYNCRDIPGSGKWSLHAYGRAIDVNPRINPYINAEDIQPGNAGPWVDRSRTDAGMLRDGDPAVLAFTGRGWDWGGHWRDPLDYQHFELP